MAGAALEARDGAHQLARAGALHAHEGHDLAGPDVQVDAAELAPVDASSPRSRRAVSRSSREVDDDLLARLALGLAHHQLGGDGVLGEVLALEHGRADPVEDDGHPVGVLDELGQPVGHEDDHVAGFGERVHAPEEVARFLVGQGGVGLVEEEDAGITGQGPGDLRALLHGERHELQRHVGERRGWPGRRGARAPASLSPRRRARVPSRPTMRLSPTVRLGNSCGSWWTTATRSRWSQRIPLAAVEDDRARVRRSSRRRGS